MTYTATATQAPAGTCSTCPYFASRHDGSTKGWCHLFDVFARSTHATTQDCVNVGGLQEDSDIAGHFEEREAEALSAQAETMTQPQVEAIEQHEGFTAAYLHNGDILQMSPNVYKVPSSSEPGVSYRVNLYTRRCTCTAGSYGRGCKHIKQAEVQQKEELDFWTATAKKVPAGWVQKGGWWYNHRGHRTNTPPVSLSPRELAVLAR